ncbi:MAG: polymorphic toxin-type HINT domain-containing protein [Phycisphaerales bacterium]
MCGVWLVDERSRNRRVPMQIGLLAIFALIAAGLGLIPAGKLLGPAFKSVGRFIGRAASAVWGAAKHYAGKAARFLWNHSLPGLMHRAASWIAKGCGCFEEGTQVQTARGLVPIDQLCEGDEVFAQDEATGEVSLRRVVRTFVRKAAPIVAVTLIGSATPALADGGAVDNTVASGFVTLNTTEEHPFLVDGGEASGAWVQAASLKPGDEVRTASGEPAIVFAVRFTGRTATVYNIEVEGLHNYRVGRDGVMVHNGGPCALLSSATALIDPRKITEYLLANSSKSGFFKDVLGFTASHADDLTRQLKNGLDTAIQTSTLKGGFQGAAKVDVPMTIMGPTGRIANVKTVWQLDGGSSMWRFITAVPN